LLYQEEWASDVCRKEIVKISYLAIGDARCLTDSGVKHKHIQSIANDGADLFGEQ
jgi:hypothetical protein